MAAVAECPSCGEGEELRGSLLKRPQSMTRHSRGTRLSIIGWRDVPLCCTCDTEPPSWP